MAARVLQNFIGSTRKKLNDILNNFSHFSYEEKVVFVSKTLRECVVDEIISSGLSSHDSKVIQFFDAILNLVEKEVAAAKLATRFLGDKVVNFKEILTSLADAVMKTRECF